MLNMFFELVRKGQEQAYKAAEAVVEKVESVVTHPEANHFYDLLDAIADKNMETVGIISEYGSALVERITTRNETKE